MNFPLVTFSNINKYLESGLYWNLHRKDGTEPQLGIIPRNSEKFSSIIH